MECMTETRTEIIEFIRDQTGRVLQETTIEDWHKNGLLPHPFPDGPNRGRYPAGTKLQAVIASKLLEKRKKKEWALMELWLWPSKGSIRDPEGLEHVRELLRRKFSEMLPALKEITADAFRYLDSLTDEEKAAISVKNATTGETHNWDDIEIAFSIVHELLNNNVDIDNELAYTKSDYNERYYQLDNKGNPELVNDSELESSLRDNVLEIFGIHAAFSPANVLSLVSTVVNFKELFNVYKTLSNDDLEPLKWEINGLRNWLLIEPTNLNQILSSRHYFDQLIKRLYEPSSSAFAVQAFILLATKRNVV